MVLAVVRAILLACASTNAVATDSTVRSNRAVLSTHKFDATGKMQFFQSDLCVCLMTHRLRIEQNCSLQSVPMPQFGRSNGRKIDPQNGLEM